MLALVLGGARSGKSRYAAEVARALSPAPVMLATSRAWDDDHRQRILRHKKDRPPEWTTIEEPLAIAQERLAGRVVVIDCVTLWLTNVFEEVSWDHERADERATREIEKLAAIPGRFILVSNELGMAPHAETEVGRRFVDVQGFVNQSLAARATAVTLMVAGIPLPVRGGDLRTALALETP